MHDGSNTDAASVEEGLAIGVQAFLLHEAPAQHSDHAVRISKSISNF
jgi:hypothetical protein